MSQNLYLIVFGLCRDMNVNCLKGPLLSKENQVYIFIYISNVAEGQGPMKNLS